MPRLYFCRGCDGPGSPQKWRGPCPNCHGLWSVVARGNEAPSTDDKASFAALSVKRIKYFSTGIPDVDRVLGGGLVKGSTVLISGPPKMGKTTLLVQVARGVAEHGSVLYTSGEQSEEDVGQIVHRTNSQCEDVTLMGNCGDIYKITEVAEETKPTLLIVDSLQTAQLDDVESAEGSSEQVKQVTNYLTAFGKRTGIAIILICHVNKEGTLAGPKAIEHLVDTITEWYPYYDPGVDDDDKIDDDNLIREFACSDNRNARGPGTVRAQFEMTTEGIVPFRKKTVLFTV